MKKVVNNFEVLKPFDYEAALAGKPVITRDGRPVTDFEIVPNYGDIPLRGTLDGERRLWKLDGREHYFPTETDLQNTD